MEAVKFPTSITIDVDSITIDGVRIALAVIPQLFYEMTHPDPRKWYRWERVGDTILVHVKIAEDTDGNIIANTADGCSSKDSGREGQKVTHP